MGRLDNKVAIITGADGGICQKASEFFCKEGAKVVMVDKKPCVEQKCAELIAAGGDAIAIVADVSIKENWEAILAKTLEKYGTVDICVNGAAEFSRSGDWDNPGLSMDEWDLVFNTNLKSMLWSYQVVLKYMLDKGIKGNFLNFSSSTALSYMGSACQAYPMTKAAIQISTNDMVAKHSASGIRFNTLAPNCVWTPNTADLFDEKYYGKWFKSVTPLGYLGAPEDAAYAMLYLCSDEAKYVTGTCIYVDGGWASCH